MKTSYLSHRSTFLSLVTLIALVLCATAAVAGSISEPSSQYVNVAPLPGAGVAIDPNGNPDGLGAAQINIPVAYTPGGNYFGISAALGGHRDKVGNELDNGNGSVSLGLGHSANKLFISAMQLTGKLSDKKCVSAQLSLLSETATQPAVAFGVQDISEAEKDNRSIYGVITKSFTTAEGRKLYASLGYGGGRFLENIFAGVSAPIGESLNVIGEWDGYQTNTGVAWRPSGRDGKFTVLGGYNGKAGLLLGIGASLNLGALGY